ncbi:thiazole synthase [Rhizobium leguminosarum bv. trifolii]|uniref:Thiazole synthase n=1 Tax=Rhizobium leguminosarum bv. trifolii TaxID=386 RepID=A0A3E1B5T1_RHILT|nr:thiazole synthase [Rhizobium leguminosarum]RFB85191.1 thiazole synthase [Rhizobium leguminosarum bv. trifolii]RFB86258.1 thiazole synthase [Rhizobium leguminosarum bv. trifolii]
MLDLYGRQIASRLLLGTARYPSPAILAEAITRSKTEIVTVSLRREMAGGRNGGAFFDMIRALGVHVLPNTAGCHGVSEAVLTAKMAREVFRTNWIKLEVIGNHDTLQPDVFALVEAARILTGEGFEVFPYTTDDLVVAERLVDAGCRVLMPWCAPIGSAAGPQNLAALRSMRAHFADVPLIVDAGIGRPSHATIVMELGFDAVLLNTAVAGAGDPAAMAEAFAKAIDAGRQAFGAGMLEPRDMAVPSTPVIGKAVFA